LIQLLQNSRTSQKSMRLPTLFLSIALAGVLPIYLFPGAQGPEGNPPHAEISNGEVHAKLYLPDAQRGYYRGSRFDWSGVVASLEYKGHNYFGVWFPHYDPRLHDAITGPVEEFRSEDGGLGYGEAKAGGTFIKIGVGVLRKQDDSEYKFVVPYEIVDGGQWTVKRRADRVDFIHKLSDKTGYAYTYHKTVRLAADKPELILEHSLKNTGKRTIDTSVYDHDFFVIDGQPTGPDFTVKFPFTVRATQDLKGLARTEGNELVYLKRLQKGDSAASYLEGYGDSAKDNDIRVENRKAGAGVRQTGDQPISKLYFWSIPTTVCPEAYIHMKIEPGQEAHWRTAYEFYTLESH
jgi:hypothetical protein